jgi:hypothetical protein
VLREKATPPLWAAHFPVVVRLPRPYPLSAPLCSHQHMPQCLAQLPKLRLGTLLRAQLPLTWRCQAFQKPPLQRPQSALQTNLLLGPTFLLHKQIWGRASGRSIRVVQRVDTHKHKSVVATSISGRRTGNYSTDSFVCRIATRRCIHRTRSIALLPIAVWRDGASPSSHQSRGGVAASRAPLRCV